MKFSKPESRFYHSLKVGKAIKSVTNSVPQKLVF